MSERASAVGRLTEKLMSLRDFADGRVQLIERLEYEPPREQAVEIAQVVETRAEEIGHLCDYIASLPFEVEPDVGDTEGSEL